MSTKSWKSTIHGALRITSHASTPFISTFILIHLSAPVLASVGGSSLSSQVMLLGREYYQTSFEPLLVFAPIGLHVASSILKRLTAPSPPPSSPLQSLNRPITSTLSLSAYALLLFYPIHLATHRLLPSSLSPPIFALSPGELDFEYVKYALHTWPWRSALLYGGLVAAWAVHAVEGANILKQTWGGRGALMKKGTRRVASAGAVVAVLAGVLSIAREPLMAFGGLASRYHASFTQVFVYRI